MYFCVVLCIVCFVLCTFMLFYVLFVCICVLYYCHRVATQLQLTNISYHINRENFSLYTACYLFIGQMAVTAESCVCPYEAVVG